MKKLVVLSLILILLVSCAGPGTGGSPNSQPEQNIQNKGSDTIVNLALAWAERYQSVQPNVRISVTGGGSGTGLASLTNGTVDIANASRQIKPEEIEVIIAQGDNPLEFIVARDAIAVIVNLENPIERLTLEQVSQIYKGEIKNWSELGGYDRPIVRTSRETNSGTHVYFLEEVIRLGRKDDRSIFSADTLLLPSSEGIISEVRDNPNAIGYDGLGYITPEVKVIPLAPDNESPYIMPSVKTVSDGSYPVARNLYMYTRNEPVGEVKIYLEWIYSAEAQQIVEELGFVPYQPPE